MIEKKCNITAIKENIRKLRENCTSKFCAVVKANAYGHGIEICKELAHEVDFFAVANVEEAMSICSLNVEKPILILGKTHPTQLYDLVKNDIRLTVDSIDDLYHLEATAKSLQKKALIHLKLNTGMNRLGIKTTNELQKFLELLNQCESIELEGIYTHFATADCCKQKLEKQNAKFKKMLSILTFEERKNLIIHASNSSAFLQSKKFCYDMVRVGIAMYGYDQTHKLNLTPALTLQSQIVKVFKIQKGETIGYDNFFKADKSMWVAVVPVGYADGFSRDYEKGYVLIKGKRAKILGHICMDMFMCDVTEQMKEQTKENPKPDYQSKTFYFEKTFTPHCNEETIFKNNVIFKLLHSDVSKDINSENKTTITQLLPIENFFKNILQKIAEMTKNMECEIKKHPFPPTKSLVGEMVTLLGKNQNEELTARDLANWSNTIEYEVLTNFNLCRESKLKM